MVTASADETSGMSATSQTKSPSVWLYGRSVDLLLGYGLGYALLVPLLFWIGSGLEAGHRLVWVPALAALLTSTPHYGATLVRVYEEREERRKYVFFTLWITLALILLFTVGLYSSLVGSLLLTVYISWSPWHFSGQNYGLAVMFLRRTDAPLPDTLKRPLYVSFVASAILAFLVIHISNSGMIFSLDAKSDSDAISLISLGIPPGMIGGGLVAATAVVYVGSLLLFVFRLRRYARLAEMGPVALLVLSQAMWFAIPALAGALGYGEIKALLPFATATSSTAHAIQYLWVSSYYAERDRAASKPRIFLLKSLLAGAAVSLPAVVLAPPLLGRSIPNAAGVLVLSFAVINIHHFFLDGAIWKLRDGRVARALLAPARAAMPEPIGPESGGGFFSFRRHGLRNVVLAFGVLAIAVKLHAAIFFHLAHPSSDLPTLRTATHELARVGRDKPAHWQMLGQKLEAAQLPYGAIDAYERAASMEERPNPVFAYHLSQMLIALRSDDPASLEEANRLALYVVERLGDRDPNAWTNLAAARAASGDRDGALAAMDAGIELARRLGNDATARRLETERRRYQRSQGRPPHPDSP